MNWPSPDLNCLVNVRVLPEVITRLQMRPGSRLDNIMFGRAPILFDYYNDHNSKFACIPAELYIAMLY